FVGEEPVHEAYLGGATGIGKSTLARITLAYQVYLLSWLRDPHWLYGHDRSTIYVFPLQSVDPAITRRVLYEPLREMFETMPFAQRHLPWNRRRTASLEFAGGIYIVPLLANPEKLLGQTIPGAILDEVNYLRIVERSFRVAGPRGLGGRYDQAEELYRELAQRRKSRFGGSAVSIGTLILSSSAHYEDDFLDRRMAEVEERAEPNIVITRHRRYDVLPADRYAGPSFRLLVGNERTQTRILEDDEEAPEGARVEDVPIEHRPEFRRDPDFALRAVIGIAAGAISPFIRRRETIAKAFELGEGLAPWVETQEVVLARDGYPSWREDALPQDRKTPHFLHIDLALSRDACGIAIIKPRGMVKLSDPESPGVFLSKPRFVVEAAIALQPSPDAEINFSKLRAWLMQLVDRHDIDFSSVTMDGYQSADTIQIFRHRGIRAEVLSVDTTPAPYETRLDCLYEERIAFVESATLRRELSQLERDAETGYVDHPPRGSKDVADAVAGAVFSATRSREIRSEIGFEDEEGDPVRYRRPRPQPKRPKGRRL
ncbi:MAG: hypothetical protein V3V17_03855, partial [Alphaproteobacteria bacterium]